MSERERQRLGIESLPASLEAALCHLQRDALVQDALGEHIYTSFLEGQRLELEDYRLQVHPWEIDQYLAVY